MANENDIKITYRYSDTGLNQIIRRTREYDSALKQTVTTTEQFDRLHGVWRTNNIAIQQSKTGLEKLKGVVGDVAVRFVGLQAILGLATSSFNQLRQWVGESIDEFRSFELRINEVATILGETGYRTIPMAAASVEYFSKQFGKSVQDLTKGYYDIVSAAFGAEEGIYLLNIATQASIAGLSDVSTAVDTLTSILNAYGMSASQTGEVSDILFQTVRYGKLVFEDLASAMGYITPIAANAGVAFKEIAAALSSVTRMGLHVDMATRGLALLIQNVISPTQQASKAAEEYSVDMSGLALRIKGLHGFMEELNAAMHEHGAAIIPEMIRNMRSLRVALALAGDEGIKGFTRDIDLMETATGRAEAAMIQIMQSSQIHANIMSQSLEYAERRIGEAWSGFDLWWKKAQVWWGTLLSGGDADAAVKNIDDRINELQKSSIKLLQTQLNVNANVKVESEQIQSFFELQDSMLEMTEQQARADQRATALKTTLYDLGIELDKISKMPIEPLGKNFAEAFGVVDKNTQLTKEQISLFNEALKDTGFQLTKQTYTLGEIQKLYENFSQKASGLRLDLQNLTESYNTGLISLQEFKAEWDEQADAIDTYKYNIVELQQAIKNLQIEVANIYTPRLLGGEIEFAGTLGYKKATLEFEMFSDRFKHFADMTIKYRDEFEGMTWFGDVQQDIWEVVAANNNYNGSIKKLIISLGKYSKQIVKINEEHEKLKKTLDANTLAMNKNNLEIMKLQLKGMMRRRGLTRTEQKAIKKYEIENAKLRIDTLENSIDVEETIQKSRIDEIQNNYDRLNNILKEYYDRENLYAWMLKDVREDELADLQKTIDWKQTLLDKYGIWLNEQVIEYETAWQSYYDNLKKLSDENKEVYEKLFGFDYFDKFKQNMSEFSELTGITFKTTTKKTKKETAISVLDTIGESIKSKTGRESITIDLLKRRLGSYQRGIEYMPKTMPIIAHKGEKIIPSGRESGGNTIIENLSIDVKEIADIGSIEKLASLLAMAESSKLIKKGRTTYRLR